ncbi:MAG: hypothetical protein HPY67_14435 [Syntrophaceae bacterium]|nr:hypothetical protein [Syntrophaceae bacterium]
MPTEAKSPSMDHAAGKPDTQGKALLREFDRLGGREILERILGAGSPREAVEMLPAQDLYWIVKKVGADDSLALLELATTDQWQYLLDLEIWDRDEINCAEALCWLRRLFEADPRRTVQWLFNEGNALVYFILQKSIEVMVREEDDKEFEIPEGFFTHDGVLYLGVRDPEQEPFIRELTGAIAAASLPAYQTLLSSLAAAVPAEVEEGMYRMRSVRLAECGFLPFEEAVSVFSPLTPEQLNREGEPDAPVIDVAADGEAGALIPFLPLHEGGQVGFLREALAAVQNPLVLERLQLEFAGLANRLASVEGLARMEMDGLVGTARRTAGYLNIALEELAGRDRLRAAALLEKNPLESVFRVGFGFVLRLKHVAENWLRIAWFRKSGFDHGFWGEERAGLLSGLLMKRPLLYAGWAEKDGALYRDFAGAEDLSGAGKALMRLIALDGLMDALARKVPIERAPAGRGESTCFHLLLTYWARLRLGLGPDVAAISGEEARALFAMLREGETAPPYRMARFRDVFLEEMLSLAPSLPDDLRSALREELSAIWEAFRSEYEEVPPADTDMRHNPFLIIE